MKFTLLTVTSVLTAISQVSAITVVTPWGNSVWTSGGHGNITWTYTAAEADLKCDIYLLNGDFTNSNIVAQITDPSTPIACSAQAYDMYPLNDFASGQYWIRIGQASTGTWSYSGLFSFVGNGTIGPISVASSATSAAAAAAGTAVITASDSQNTASATASLAADSDAIRSGASVVSASGAALALSAIAAIAFNL